MQVDIDDQDTLLGYVARFTNQHVGCGFATPPPEEPEQTAQTFTIKRTALDDEDE
jgi:hypothetical protein